MEKVKEHTVHIINQGDGMDSVQVWQAYAMCAISIMLMLAIRSVVTKFGKPETLKDGVSFWKWRNILISWIHAVIVGTWDFMCLWWYPDLFQDPVFYINNVMYLMVPFSIGYFLYDLYDMMTNEQQLIDWEIVLHHVLLSTVMIYSWTNKLCIAYSVILLTSEINSIFLHLRKLLQFTKVNFNSWLYQLVAMLNLFTFITCRLFPQSRLMFGFYTDGHRISKSYFILLLLTYPIGFVINIVLFWRILKSDVLRRLKGNGKLRNKME
ncbi:unnamed protein product [Mytilus edulis]|uniref:TLC domain-containing protein n=1 Tax=Mytilus edulis TaxID=6550 RepID=A0A8S3RVT2_MYTED|nr:unnamed protein product [Mytilus edulis]